MQSQCLTAALQEDDTALQCDPNFVGAWQTRIDILGQQGKAEKTPHCYERIIEISPMHEGIVALNALVAYYRDKTQPDEAVKALEHAGDVYLQLVKGKEPSAEFFQMPYFLATQYVTIKQAENAITWLDRASACLDQLPPSSDAVVLRFKLAELYLKLQRPDQAVKVIASLERVLVLVGSLKEPPDGNPAAKDTIARLKATAEGGAYATRTRAYEILGNQAAAKADYDRILQSAPMERFNAAQTFFALEQPDKTIALLDSLLAGKPQGQDAAAMLWIRAQAWELKGNLDAAKADYERIQQMIREVEAAARAENREKAEYCQAHAATDAGQSRH